MKTTSTADGTYKTRLGQPTPGISNTLEPAVIRVTKGYKIFLNICYDPVVPPPPDRSEDQIRRAMLGADSDDREPSASNSNLYYVPVIVSDGKPVTDKGA